MRTSGQYALLLSANDQIQHPRHGRKVTRGGGSTKKASVRKHLMKLAGLVAMVMVLTGCFTIRGWSWDDYKLKPGENAKVSVNLKPAFPSVESDGYAVVLIGYKDLEPKKFDKFDTQGNYGGPFEGIRSVSLENHMLSTCTAAGVTIEDFDADSWVAFRSEEEVTATGKKNLRFRHRAGPSAGEDAIAGSLLVVSGTWTDDGDLVAEDFEVTCSGFVLIPIQINQA